MKKPASWSSSNAIVFQAKDLRFKSRADQIGHSVASGSSSCYVSSKGAVLPGRNDVGMGQQICYTLRRNT